MQFKVGLRTDIGRKRKQNQDNLGAYPEIGLFIVADGMGGHQGGEIASSMVVKLLPESVKRAREQLHPWDSRKAIIDAISAANRAIYTKAQDALELQGMGTTTTAMLFDDEHLTIGHVGDSRCYYINPTGIWQLTRDHSLVQEKLRAGLITRSQLKTDRMKNVITRSVGFEPDVSVETYEMRAQTGDVFLICSDGLSGLVEDGETLSWVQKRLFKSGDVQNAVDALIEAANSHGGDDNVTALVVQVV